MRGELPLLFSPRKHCAPPTSPLMSPKQRMTPSQRIPKKSKNPTKPGISSSTRLDDNADTDDLDDQLEKLTAQLSSLAVQQIEAPQPNQEASQEEEIVLDVLTLEQYEAAVAAGGVKPYRGKGGTAREMYDAGKAFNARTKRWVKAEKAKAEGEQRAVRSELARLRQEMERMVAHQRRTQELLALQRAVDAKKAEKLRRQEAALRAAAAGGAGAAGAGAAAAARDRDRDREEGDLAPVLWVFDTNVWMEDAATGDVRYAANVVLSARPDVQLLLPREVLRELDGLKKGGPGRGDERAAFRAREGSRLVEELLTDPRGLGAGRRYPLLRGQRDGELWRDPQGGIHGRPERLRADAAVLNCCLHFARARCRRVVLLSRDRNLRQVARVNGVEAADPCPQRGANLYALGRDEKEAGGGDRRDGGAGQWGGGGVWEEPLSSGGERREGLLGSRPMQYGSAR